MAESLEQGILMADILVGNAPCSWGKLEFDGLGGDEIPFGQMLDELVAAGYTGTELGDWGYMPTDPELLRAELQCRELTMLGAFVAVAFNSVDALEEGMERAVRTARLLESVASIGDPHTAPFLVLADENGTIAQRTRHAGRITEQMGLDDAGWGRFSHGVNDVARRVLEETGLRTVFHHHAAGC